MKEAPIGSAYCNTFNEGVSIAAAWNANASKRTVSAQPVAMMIWRV